MKYVFFTLGGNLLSIAKRLSDEGNEVLVGMLRSDSQMEIPGVKDKETSQEKIRRMSLYDGMIDKHSVESVFRELGKVRNRDKGDYFFFFDYNDLYNISERALKMGFTQGLFPTKFYYLMEKERSRAKSFVKANYPSISVADSFSFKIIQEGIDFIGDTEDKVYVLKSNGNAGGTVVPKTEDTKLAKEILIDTLKKHKREYEDGGFMFEEKIPNCLEVTPILAFYEGVPVYSVVEFESKQFGAGDIGLQKGGNISLNVRTKLDCKLNQMAFPQIIHELAENHPGLALYDIGLLYNGEDFYFTEFCAMRYGWDGVFSEMVMRDTDRFFVSSYFEDLVAGRNPLRYKYGVSIRMFSLCGGTEKTVEPPDGTPIYWDKETENNLFLYRVKKLGHQIVSIGGLDLLAVATGAEDTLEAAVKKAYRVVSGFVFDNLYYRPEFDFMSKAYKSAIRNRLAAVFPFIKD